jgi:hypothetical protein
MDYSAKKDFSSHRVVLAYADNPKLTPEEYRKIRDAKKALDTIAKNLTAKNDAFSGISKKEKQELLAYLTFSRENGFTDIGKGHTPVEDSAKVLIRKPGLFGDEEDLDTQLVKQVNKHKEKPFKETLEQDEQGNVKAVV